MRDGGRDKTDEGIQQIKYPSCKEFKKKHDALGEKNCGISFCEITPSGFRDKKLSEII